eukprot:9478921-Pyramimonas_sp.AAC.1
MVLAEGKMHTSERCQAPVIVSPPRASPTTARDHPSPRASSSGSRARSRAPSAPLSPPPEEPTSRRSRGRRGRGGPRHFAARSSRRERTLSKGALRAHPGKCSASVQRVEGRDLFLSPIEGSRPATRVKRPTGSRSVMISTRSRI